jgi:hypothetical protein
MRTKNDRPIQKKGRSDALMRADFVLKFCRSKSVVGCGLDGFFRRVGIDVITFEDDCTQFWNFDLYTR